MLSLKTLFIEFVVSIKAASAPTAVVTVVAAIITPVIAAGLEFRVALVTVIAVAVPVIPFPALIGSVTFYIRGIGEFQLSFCQDR